VLLTGPQLSRSCCLALLTGPPGPRAAAWPAGSPLSAQRWTRSDSLLQSEWLRRACGCVPQAWLPRDTRHTFAGSDAPAGQLYVCFLMCIRHFGLFLFEHFSDYSTQRQTYTAVGKVIIIWPGPAGPGARSMCRGQCWQGRGVTGVAGRSNVSGSPWDPWRRPAAAC
jgi:hypothetical protein